MQAPWPSENILLGLLCEQPLHGYALAMAVRDDEALRAIWRFERSEVYFLLGKLAQKGFVAPAGVEQASGPARTTYAPTEAGRAALVQWLQTPEEHARNLRTSLLARVYLALRLDPALAVELIDEQKGALAAWLERERSHQAGDEVVRLVRRLRAAQVEATLRALDDLRVLAVNRATITGEAQGLTP